MDAQLYIPKNIQVGYQKRQGTYTGKLGYVIYQDDKKVWRKQKSWDGWRDKTLGSVILDNTPHSGFHLNKGVQRNGYWGNGHSMCRIYDSRGFEFEITIDNLMFILMGSNCSKRELEGEFVYSWNGAELVLLPTNSEEYKSSQKFSKLQSDKVSAKDLILGATYQTKDEDSLIYLGKFNVNSFESKYISYELGTQKTCSIKNKHVFYVPGKLKRMGNYLYNDSYRYEETKFVFFSDLKNLANCLDEQPVINYATLVDEFLKSSWGSKVASINTQQIHGSDLLSFSERKRDDWKSWGYDLPEKKISIGEAFEPIDENTFKFIQIHGITKFKRDGQSSSYGRLQIVNYEVTSTKTVHFINNSIVVKDNSKKDNRVYTESQIKSLPLVKLVLSLERGTTHKLKY